MGWEPSGLGKTFFEDRYTLFPGESWSQAARRVANCVAKAEDSQGWGTDFYNEIVNNRFMPGGRIMHGAGKPKAQLLNCFVIPLEDSREGWGKSFYDMTVISGLGGGVGVAGTKVRGRGFEIKGTGGKATGAISVFQAIDGIGTIIADGGGRRTALMFGLAYNHPDIEEFLHVKLDKKQLNNANISVIIEENPEDFAKKVLNGEDIELEFEGKKTGKTINARELWYNLTENAWKSGEPGVLNGYLANKMSNIWYYKPLICTNPCLTGDTMVAVADGRNAVSISQLATEGKAVPVYCSDPESGQTIIRMAHNPRKTGYKEVWKVTLDDGSNFRATADHRIMLKSGEFRTVQDLLVGDSVRPFNSYESNGYRQIAESGMVIGKGGRRRSRRQYRLIWESIYGNIDKGMNVHHKDFHSHNDAIENLELMTEEDHRQLHSLRMQGLQNPYFRKSVDEKLQFASHPGQANPKYIDVTNEELLDYGRECWTLNGGNISQSIWVKYAKEKGLPQFLANEFRFSSWNNFKLAVAGNHKIASVVRDGYEEVFDLTVEDVHNYHIITSGEEGYIRSSGLAVHNCGEIWLEEYGCCDLGALVLPRFVHNKTIDWDQLRETIKVAVRFLDDVLTVNYYPLPEIERNCKSLRRIGLGVMGLHSMLLEMGYRYSSHQGRMVIDQLFNFIKEEAYQASIELAKEKGSFPEFIESLFLRGEFIQTLSRDTQEGIAKHGIRNCALLTVAPTGTTGVVSGVSTGIEPLFSPVYWRHFYRQTEEGMRYLDKELVVSEEFNRYPEIVEGAYDLSPREHLEMQKIVQRHIDNSVSKTINLPREFEVEELAELWLEYLPYIKGSTFYREGSRELEPYTSIRTQDARAVIENYQQQITESNMAEQSIYDCPDGVCELPQPVLA